MIEHSDAQLGTFTVYRRYHERLRRAVSWCCFVDYRPHGLSGCTIIKNRMMKASSLPMLRWHGGGEHRETQQAKIAISNV